MRLPLALALSLAAYLLGAHVGARAERAACDREAGELLATAAELQDRAVEVGEVARSCEVASRAWLETARWYQRAYIRELGK